MEKMKVRNYISPKIKVHEPKFLVLDSIGVGGSGNPEKPIEIKGNNFYDDDQQNMWGNSWGRSDD